MLDVNVEYNGQQQNLPLFVVKNGGPALFGRQWLDKIKLDWKSIKHIPVMEHTGSMQEQLDALKLAYKEVFQGGLGAIKRPKSKLHLKEGATPKFHKARQVPYSQRPTVEAELDKLE